MGYLITFALFSFLSIVLVTFYQIMPQHLRNNIDALIDEIGGVK
jgi:hypothetical protein